MFFWSYYVKNTVFWFSELLYENVYVLDEKENLM